MGETNKQLVQRMTQAFLKGDMATVQDLWEEDIVWHFPGCSAIAGEFHGKEAVLKHLSGPRQLGGSFKMTPRAFFGDKKYGAALYEITSARNGKTLTETRVMVCTIDNGKVVEARIYPADQYALDEFWS
jgi:ketosteroid isomerase-like protein